ncbi:hypothetical protein V2L05_12355 [Pseudomonas alliivorans]|uniref:hypothetical protein n=1 Tax=Pseudomonas viridiflava TaxID=33069 RepID=UPI00117AC969|nr:hypothetical protein [Pseudomonas viridiflava]MEE4617256.1 hypothetical protein [Pseudomonas alliivorans]MEE4670014.1 hypothetical protein [Pseudomonas alliivorans]MEE4754541.1 hypothetical protein [Pseudomonas alliivorans]MEE4811632.1 hypothetical protein [Pseudomonas alliivorans]MEE4873448.1 hypothetical protein [Pseudomonas alliivorans]
MKFALPLVLLLVSIESIATDFSVTSDKVPGIILASHTPAISMHRLRFSDYPLKAVMRSRLKGVSWNITSFPDAIDHTAELCYQTTGVNDVECYKITPGINGYTERFNNLGFEYNTSIKVRHSVEGGPTVIRPMGRDMVTFHLTY